MLWHTWRMRGCSESIQALTIASSADMLSPHCALSKPLNLYTSSSFRLQFAHSMFSIRRRFPLKCNAYCIIISRILPYIVTTLYFFHARFLTPVIKKWGSQGNYTVHTIYDVDCAHCLSL